VISKRLNIMRKSLIGILLLAGVLLFPLPTMAEVFVDVNISLPLPPRIEFVEPPELIVLPETYIYVVPDVDMEIFFYGGWWWQLWENRWYRSRDYDSGWTYYRNTPSFYRQVPSYWRTNYSENRWSGHEWNYQRIPEQHVRQNWRNWEKKRYWEHQQTWGVEDLRPQMRSRQQIREVQQPRRSRQAVQEVQPRQSRQIIREVQQPRQVREHRNAGPQIRKEVRQTRPEQQMRRSQQQVRRPEQQQGKRSQQKVMRSQQQQGKHAQQQQGKQKGGKGGKHEER
jgi:hypothetical protein